MPRAKQTKQVPPCRMQDSPVFDAHWGFKEGSGQLQDSHIQNLGTAQPRKHPWLITQGGFGSSPPTLQQLQQPNKPKGQGKYPGVPDGKGTQGPRLTFLRLEEAVLSQLGQERTAGTGRFEVAQGNVRWVETVRQMGKACRKRETEEGNMFYPEQHAALERAPQEHRLLWLSVPRTPGAAVAAGTHTVTHSTHTQSRDPCSRTPLQVLTPPLWVPQLTPDTSGGSNSAANGACCFLSRA